MKYIKNTTESSIVLEGYTIAAGTYQLIDPDDYTRVSGSSILYSKLASGDLVVAEDNTGNTDIADLNLAINFMKNIVPQDVSISEQKWYRDALGYRSRWKGFSGTATGGQTTDLDFLISNKRFINGMAIILTGAVTGDYAAFQIVDVDGVYYDAGTVLDTFVDNWYFSGESERQCNDISDYPARILAGLYIRIKYTSTGQNNVTVYCNAKLHQVPEE